MNSDNPGMAMFRYQPPAILNQPAPVNGTYYEILPETDLCRVYHFGVNIEDADETLEVEVTIDGQTMEGVVAATHSVRYYGYLYPHAILLVDAVSIENNLVVTNRAAFKFEGHKVRVRLRKTTALGAGNLTGIVMYGVLRHA